MVLAPCTPPQYPSEYLLWSTQLNLGWAFTSHAVLHLVTFGWAFTSHAVLHLAEFGLCLKLHCLPLPAQGLGLHRVTEDVSHYIYNEAVKDETK